MRKTFFLLFFLVFSGLGAAFTQAEEPTLSTFFDDNPTVESNSLLESEEGTSLSNFFNDRESADESARHDEPAFNVTVEMDRADGKYLIGEKFQLKILTEKSGYLYVFNEAGEELKLIYPNTHERKNSIDAKTKFIYPPSNSSFSWQISGKVGDKEKIHVYVAEQQLDIKGLGLDKGIKNNDALVMNPVSVVPNFAIVQATVSYQIVESREDATAPEEPTVEGKPKRIAMIFTQSHLLNSETGEKEPDNTIEFRIGNLYYVLAALKKYGNFSDIYFLNGENFIKTKIQSAFQILAEMTNPGDEIFIYWEGHGGSGIKDTTGTEADGVHEYLFLYDFHTNEKDGYIQDDEIGDMLLLLKERRVMIIFETCHSGGLMRSNNSRDITIKYDRFLNNINDSVGPNVDFSQFLNSAYDVVSSTNISSARTDSVEETIDFSDFFKSVDGTEEKTLSNFFDRSEKFSSEPASVFISNMNNRIKSAINNDIAPDMPNIAIIFACSESESSYCAVIDKDGNVMKFKDSDGVERPISASAYSLVLAMSDLEGEWIKHKDCAFFDDVWSLAKEIIPNNAKRIAELNPSVEQKNQIPVYMSTIKDICVRPSEQ